MIKVLIVDEELLAGVRIERLLAATKNIEVIGVAVNGSDAQAISDKQNPDILLLKCPISPFSKKGPVVKYSHFMVFKFFNV